MVIPSLLYAIRRISIYLPPIKASLGQNGTLLPLTVIRVSIAHSAGIEALIQGKLIGGGEVGLTFDDHDLIPIDCISDGVKGFI